MAGCKRAAEVAEALSSPTAKKPNINNKQEDQNGGSNATTEGGGDKKKTDGQNFKDLSGFKLKSVLSNSADSKRLTVEGTFSDGQAAVVILDKKPFTEESFSELFSSESKLQQIFQNDIYGNYDCIPGVKSAGKILNLHTFENHIHLEVKMN